MTAFSSQRVTCVFCGTELARASAFERVSYWSPMKADEALHEGDGNRIQTEEFACDACLRIRERELQTRGSR